MSRLVRAHDIRRAAALAGWSMRTAEYAAAAAAFAHLASPAALEEVRNALRHQAGRHDERQIRTVVQAFPARRQRWVQPLREGRWPRLTPSGYCRGTAPSSMTFRPTALQAFEGGASSAPCPFGEKQGGISNNKRANHQKEYLKVSTMKPSTLATCSLASSSYRS